MSVIVNGPSLLEANLGLEICHFRFQDSNHTLSPFLNGVNPYCPQAAMTCQASLWAAKASSQAAWRRLSLCSSAGRGELGWCGDPYLPGLVYAHPIPCHHHSTSPFLSQIILFNPLSNPCICLSGSFNPLVVLPRKHCPVPVLCPCHYRIPGESFSTLLS